MKASEKAFFAKHNIPEPDLRSLYSVKEDGWVTLATEKLKECLNDLEKMPSAIKKLSETEISGLIATAINQSFLLIASTESNSRGHVDLTLTSPTFASPHVFEFKGEAKIWAGPAYAIKGFDQIMGYATGRHKGVFLIFYFLQPGCDTIFDSYLTELVREKGGVATKTGSRHHTSEHSHLSTSKITLEHLAGHFP